MKNAALKIIPYNSDFLEEVLEVTIRAWTPVFPLMQKEIPKYIYQAFYPNGWKARQLKEVEAICEDTTTDVWLALSDNRLSGYLGLRAHEEDSMGEIYIIAVDPDFQRQGVGTALLEFALKWMREKNLDIAMVETGGDQGHAPSCQTYESAGFKQYPVARYFRKL